MGSGFKLGVRCMIFGVRYSVSLTLKILSSTWWPMNPLLMRMVEVNGGVVARLRVILGHPRGSGNPACPFAGPV